jgi:two-component system response regulator RegX3
VTGGLTAQDKGHLLVVEDDEASRTALTRGLTRHGYSVQDTADGQSALTLCDPQVFDLMILDVGLPDIDGFTVLTKLRHRTDIPVIMLTGRGEEVDRVVGFELGADDYVLKPYSLRELVARVAARLRSHRRGQEPDEADEIQYAQLRLDRRAREVRLDGNRIDLTAREYELLVFLASQPRQVFSREELLERVWGTTYQDPATVTEHVRRVRAKLGGNHGITTLRGVGYRFDP